MLPAGPMVPARHRVQEVQRELADTVTLVLVPLDEPLAPFRAGQFNMLWGFGTGEVPISVSGDPTGGGPLLHTVRAVGPSTRALCDVAPGDVIGARGPYGTSWDVERAAGRNLLVVAGGLGLAPLRPAILQALAERAAFEQVTVVLGARSPADLLYPDQVTSWAARPDVSVHVTVDHAESGWDGQVGVVTTALRRVDLDPTRTTALVCGPEIMMRHTAAALVSAGMDPADVRVSLERNMTCAIGHCGHCQIGPTLVCRDGPVYGFDEAAPLMATRGR